MRSYSLAVVFALVGTSSGNDHLALLQQKAEIRVNPGIPKWFTQRKLGSVAPLTEKGYQDVANLTSDDEMRVFINRVVEKEARYVTEGDKLSGVVPYYSGTKAVQTLERLKSELSTFSWVGNGEGRTAPLNEVGYQSVAKLQSQSHMMAFARRILDAARRKSVDEGALHGLVQYFDGEHSVQSYGQLEKELLSANWTRPRDEQISLASRAPRSSDKSEELKEQLQNRTQMQQGENSKTLEKQQDVDAAAIVTNGSDTKTLEREQGVDAAAVMTNTTDTTSTDDELNASLSLPELFEFMLPLDTDGDGSVTLSELFEFMSPLDGKMTAFAVEEFFTDSDLNDDGTIDHHELQHIMA